MTTKEQMREWYQRNREQHIRNVLARRKAPPKSPQNNETLHLDGWEERFKMGYAAGRRWHNRLFKEVREDFLQEIRLAALIEADLKQMFKLIDKRLRKLEREIL